MLTDAAFSESDIGGVSRKQLGGTRNEPEPDKPWRRQRRNVSHFTRSEEVE